MEKKRCSCLICELKDRAKKQKLVRDLAKQIAEESRKKATDALTEMMYDCQLRQNFVQVKHFSSTSQSDAPNFQNIPKKDYSITQFFEDMEKEEASNPATNKEAFDSLVRAEREKLLYEELKAKAQSTSQKPPYALNFCRVFELPDTYPEGYCFGGGKPVTMLMVDWFNPWPDYPDLKTWDDVTKLLLPFLQKKVYVKPGKRYVLITDFGTSLVFGSGV